MNTQAAVDIFGSVRALAAALNISVQAVYLWGDTVPKLRQYEIRELRPDAFNADGTLRERPKADIATSIDEAAA